MALDYGLPGAGFTGNGGSMGMPDAAMLGSILSDLTAKITVKTEEVPQDYTGVPKKTKTVEEVDLAAIMPGPAPIMMNMGPPPPQQIPQMPQMQQPMQQMPGSMGVQAAQSVMQQPFG